MVFYIVVDILILIFLFMGDINNLTLKKISKYSILLIFFVVAGLSYKIHNDMYAYQHLFENLTLSMVSETAMEPGFVFLNYIAGLFVSFYPFKILVYILTTILIYKGIRSIVRREEEVFVLAILYFIASFYMFYATTFRQAIAIAIFIYAFKYLKEFSNTKYYVSILLAMTFHFSAVLLLLFPIIWKWHKNSLFNDLFILLIGLTLGLSPILDTLIIYLFSLLESVIPKISIYTADILNGLGLSIPAIAIILLSIIIVILFNTKEFKPTKEEKFMYTGFIVFMILFFLGLKIAVMYRMLLYLYVFMAFGLILLLRRFRDNILKLMAKYILVLGYIVLFNLIPIRNAYKNDARYVPYHSYLETFFYDIPYQETSQSEHMKTKYGTGQRSYQF